MYLIWNALWFILYLTAKALWILLVLLVGTADWLWRKYQNRRQRLRCQGSNHPNPNN